MLQCFALGNFYNLYPHMDEEHVYTQQHAFGEIDGQTDLLTRCQSFYYATMSNLLYANSSTLCQFSFDINKVVSQHSRTGLMQLMRVVSLSTKTIRLLSKFHLSKFLRQISSCSKSMSSLYYTIG